MTAYNRLNGWLPEDPWLLNTVLREWLRRVRRHRLVRQWLDGRFGGSTDLEMPGQGRFYGQPPRRSSRVRSTRRTSTCWSTTCFS